MSKISEEEKENLKKIIKSAGLHTISSTEEFEKCLDNCMEGFLNNPLYAHICGKEADPTIIKEIFSISYRAVEKNAITYADSPSLNAFAVWIPSGVNQTDFKKFFSEGISSLPKLGGLSIFPRILRYETAVSGMKKSLTNHNDWYLYCCQSRPNPTEDYFIKLVSPVAIQAWKTGRACYVELNEKSKISALRKLGFHIVDEITIPQTNIKLYGMMV